MNLRLLMVVVALAAACALAPLGAAEPAPLPEPVVAAILQLGSSDGATREAALAILAQNGDARVLPALDAFYKGMFKVRDKRPVLFGSKTEVPGKGQVYPLIDAITLKPVADAAGAPLYEPGLTGALGAKSSERKSIKAIMGTLELRHPDPLKRREAIISVADRGDGAVLPDLKTQLEREADVGFNRLLRESIARIQLKQSSGAEQSAAITALGEMRASRALPDLQEHHGAAVKSVAKLEAEIAVLTAAAAGGETLKQRWDAANHAKDDAAMGDAGKVAAASEVAVLAGLGVPDADPAAVAAKAKNQLAGKRTALTQQQQFIADCDQAMGMIESRQALWRRVSHVFSGISLGSILILLALGLSIIFGLMGVINMAHGELMMIGAYTTWGVSNAFTMWCPGWFDWYLVVAIPASFATAALVGWLIEFLVIRHLYGRPLETLLATWGISLVLIQCARVPFGDTLTTKSPSWLMGGWAVSDDFVLPFNRLFIIAFAIACIVLMYAIINWTKLGLLLRATTQNRQMASCLGVPTRRIDGLTFALGAGLAGLAGVAVPMFDKINPNMGQGYIVDSFMVVVTGGVGKLAGVIWSGLGLGWATKFIEPFLQAVFTKVAILGLIIVFLQWRPSGLFPAKGRHADV